MRKALIALSIAAVTALSGCGGASAQSSTPDYIASLSRDGYDCDLTQLNANMMYAQIYDMVYNPSLYAGKTVRVTGNFNYYKDSEGNEIFAAFIPDAQACCSQGIEFVLEGEHKYPDDYPEQGDLLTVAGVFNSYKENNATYCQLLHAEMLPTIEEAT